MRDIFTVVKFTMKDMVKRKSFIISTLIILTFIVVGFNVPNLIKSFNGDNSGNKLLIIDSKNVFEGTLENLKQMDLGYEFEITNEDLKFEDVKKKIENEYNALFDSIQENHVYREMLKYAKEKIEAYFEPPKSTSKKQTEQMLENKISPTKKPDIDNIIKIVLDALNKMAFRDDSQVTKIEVEKIYGPVEKIKVKIDTY